MYVVSGILKILIRREKLFSYFFVSLSLPLFILRNEEAYTSISLDIAKFSSTGIDRLKWLAFSLFRRHYPNFATESINASNYGTNARPTFMGAPLRQKGATFPLNRSYFGLKFSACVGGIKLFIARDVAVCRHEKT